MNHAPRPGDWLDGDRTGGTFLGELTDPEPAPHRPWRLGLDIRILTVEAGPFDARHLIGDPQESFGLLILDGLILAEREAGRMRAAWLVGAEDLLRPWEMSEIALVRGAHWRALKPSRVLRIDRSFRQRLQNDPRLVQQLLACATRTSHWLFAKSLVISSPLIEDRLLLLFALWAERWGKVTPKGVSLDLPITHQLIAALCGARRPTVSIALHSLAERGAITRVSRSGWLLRRGPGLSQPCGCWQQYTASLGPALGDNGCPD